MSPTSSSRLPILMAASSSLLAFMLWMQLGELDRLSKKNEGRQERIEALHDLIRKHPSLLNDQSHRLPSSSKTIAKGASPSKDSSSNEALTLTAMFSEVIASQHLDAHVVSLNPSHDSKKRLDKIRCQLKSLRFEKAIELIQILKQSFPKLQELDIDLQAQKNQRFNLTGTWALPSS